MLTKEPEMLQPDAFYEHTMQQNATAAGDPAGGAYSAPSDFILVLRRPLRGGEGKGKEGKGRGGEVDSDAQLEQGRRLAKAGPDFNSSNFTTQ